MTALTIIGSIVLLVLIPLFIPVRLCVWYVDGGLKVVLKYLFFGKTLADMQNKTVYIKKITDTGKSAGISSDNADSKVEYFFEVVKSSGWAFRKLLRRIKVKDIVIDFTISDEDACECAVKYGAVNCLVYNALTAMGYFIRLKKKAISIKCVYNKPESVYDISFKVCVLPAAVVAIFIGFCWGLVKLVIKHKKQERMDELEKSPVKESTSAKKEDNDTNDQQ